MRPDPECPELAFCCKSDCVRCKNGLEPDSPTTATAPTSASTYVIFCARRRKKILHGSASVSMHAAASAHRRKYVARNDPRCAQKTLAQIHTPDRAAVRRSGVNVNPPHPRASTW